MTEKLSAAPWYTDASDALPVNVHPRIHAQDKTLIAEVGNVEKGREERWQMDALLITFAVNSYRNHCGDRAIEAAQRDILGEALEALEFARAETCDQDVLDACNAVLEIAHTTVR